MLFDVIDWRHKTLAIEVNVRRDTVELRADDRLVGVTDREKFRLWLEAPAGDYAYDDVAWVSVPGGVALAIANLVPAWVLADHILDALRACI